MLCLQPSASNLYTKQQLDCQKDAAAQVKCDGISIFSTSIRQEKPKDNGNETDGQREFQYKPCGFAQGRMPDSQNLKHRQQHDQPDRKMNQQRMKAAEELKPVSMRLSI